MGGRRRDALGGRGQDPPDQRVIGDTDADDRIGDDDGLCESGEDCVYTPNIGSYQGHDGLSGSYTTVGDIRLFEYSTNGRD